MKLLKVDELILSDHYYLNADDGCYYFMEYTAGGGYQHSHANQLILNFKMSLEKKDTPPWKYKTGAINEVAGIVNKSVMTKLDLSVYTFVPVMPSKCKEDPLYDDRITNMLNRAAAGTDADVRELFYLKETVTPAHLAGSRPTPTEIFNYTSVNKAGFKKLKKEVIIVDDVLTTGAHFKAYQRLILENAPDTLVHGIFIARRAIP